VGVTHANVKSLQLLMDDVGWHTGANDGDFGNQTKASVQRMQGTLRVGQDGVYGPVTATALSKWLGTKVPAPTPVPEEPDTDPDWVKVGQAAATPPGIPNLKFGVTHTNVTTLQAILCSMPTLPGDGTVRPIYAPHAVGEDQAYNGGPWRPNFFGIHTNAALKYWQSKNGKVAPYGSGPLPVDGVYGPMTAATMKHVRGK
jgi:peptidoglycan hydrolase-like protein with peptidoglycan-binding domain